MTALLVGLALLLLPSVSLAQSRVPAPTHREALGYYRDGLEQLASERWDAALEAFDHAVALEPIFPDAHYGRGQAFMGLERFASAAQAFGRCLETARAIHALRDRDRLEAQNQLNDALFEMRDTARRLRSQAGKRLEADVLEQRIVDLEKLRATPQGPFVAPPAVLLALGSAHYRNGNAELAEYYWSEAVRVNETFGQAWNNLAVVYLRTGRKEAAERAVRKAEAAGFTVHPRLKQEIRALK